MKRIISFLLSLIFIFSTLPLSTLKISASPFMGGDGSEANPYLVGTPEALDAVRNYPTSCFRQTADIDLSSWGNWEPIDRFKGSYDGNTYIISNVTIVTSAENRSIDTYGLFGESGGKYSNINLCNLKIDVKGRNYVAIQTATGDHSTMYVGGICAYGGSFFNCTVKGNISINDCANVYAGGICATNAADINHCQNYVDISISATERYNPDEPIAYCGGIIGAQLNNYEITNCANFGNIDLKTNVFGSIGGICGYLEGNLNNCVNFGNVNCTAMSIKRSGTSSDLNSGGIVGKTKATIKKCINYGDVIATGKATEYGETSASAGSICPDVDSWWCQEPVDCINISVNVFYQITKGNDHHIYDYAVCNYSAAELLQESTYKNFDFKNTWVIDSTVGGAVLQGVGAVAVPGESIIDELTKYYPDFNELIYRADHLTSGKMNILTDDVMYGYLLTNTKSPSKIIIDSHPENMHTVAAAWEAMQAALEAATDGPAVAYKQHIKQQDIITAYILGSVGAYTQTEYANVVKNNFKQVQGLVDTAKELNDTFVAAGGDFKSFAKDKKGTLASLLSDYYKDSDPTMSAFAKTQDCLNLIGSLIEITNTFEDLYDKIISYAKLYELNQSTKKALTLMYEVCPEEASDIKASLKSCVEIVNMANEEMFADIVEREVVTAFAEETAYVLIENTWKYYTEPFLKACPLAESYLKFAKSQMTVVDKMLGIDARVEQYFKMCIFTELDRVAGLAVNQAMINYKNKPTTDNAAVFLASIDLKFGFIDQDYKEAITYSEIISDAGILLKIKNSIKSITGEDTTNELKNSLQKAETGKNLFRCTIATSWITELENEYPGTAQEYYEYKNKIYTLYCPEYADVLIPIFENSRVRIYIHCPVNVTVYNSAGEIVAEVGENEVWSSGKIAVVYDHGEKDIYFFDNSEYRIVCEGYDAGDMDISITNYDSDGNITQTVNYNNVPVASGSMHTLSEEQVTDGNGALLEVDFDSTADAEKHKITISYGVIEGYLAEHEAAKGERVEISAIIPEGYRFVGWVGEVEFEDVKASSTYFFMPDSDITISAKLKKIENDDGEDDENDNGVLRVIIIICACGAGVVILGGTAILIITIKKRKIIVSKEKQQ